MKYLSLIHIYGVADDYFPNETEMLRLYFDLVINGILPKESAPGDVSSLTQQQLSLIHICLLALTYVSAYAYNVIVICLLKPVDYDRSIKSAGIFQYNLILSQNNSFLSKYRNGLAVPVF